MANRDRKLRKEKERKKKIAKKKLRLREERRVAALKEKHAELLAMFGETVRGEDEDDDSDEHETDSKHDDERFARYFRKRAIKLGYDPEAIEPEQEKELISGWEFQRDALLEEDPEEFAQDFAFDAMDAADDDDWEYAESLAKDALATDPRNVDALIILANAAINEDMDEGYRKLREVVSLAHAALGGEIFINAYKGRLGERVEAKPYLRARDSLASFLGIDGRTQEAITEYSDLMELDADERKSYAKVLLGYHLKMGRVEEARKLLAFRKDKNAPDHLWGRVLMEFLSGNPDEAEKALEIAGPLGKRFVDLLLKADVPNENGDSDEEDTRRSYHLMAVQGGSWFRHPAALEWLGRHHPQPRSIA